MYIYTHTHDWGIKITVITHYSMMFTLFTSNVTTNVSALIKRDDLPPVLGDVQSHTMSCEGSTSPGESPWTRPSLAQLFRPCGLWKPARVPESLLVNWHSVWNVSWRADLKILNPHHLWSQMLRWRPSAVPLPYWMFSRHRFRRILSTAH